MTKEILTKENIQKDVLAYVKRRPSPNYTWSKTFYMSGQGIENTSLVGDEFYLVILHSTQEICAVYNTKFFVYEG